MTAVLAMKASHESASTVSATINVRFIVCVSNLVQVMKVLFSIRENPPKVSMRFCLKLERNLRFATRRDAGGFVLPPGSQSGEPGAGQRVGPIGAAGAIASLSPFGTPLANGSSAAKRLLFQLMDVTAKAFWRSRTIAQQISWPARACAPAGGQEISGSSRACNVCSADSNADTRGGKSRASSPFGTPRSTAPALPSCISWFATRPK